MAGTCESTIYDVCREGKEREKVMGSNSRTLRRDGEG